MSVGSKKCIRDVVGYSLCLRVQKNAPVMSVKSRLCLWVQKNAPATMLVAFRVCGFKKMYPRCCWLLFASVDSKKCTRNNAWLLFVFAGLKKCTRRQSGMVVCEVLPCHVIGCIKIYPWPWKSSVRRWKTVRMLQKKILL